MYRYDEFDAAFVRERTAQFRDQVSRRLSVGFHLPDGRVEVCGRVQRDVVILGDHPGDQSRPRLVAHVPTLEERLLDQCHRVPHRRVVGREAHRGVGDDVELLARRPRDYLGRVRLGKGPIYLSVNAPAPRVRTNSVSIRRDARSPTVYDLSS